MKYECSSELRQSLNGYRQLPRSYLVIHSSNSTSGETVTIGSGESSCGFSMTAKQPVTTLISALLNGNTKFRVCEAPLSMNQRMTFFNVQKDNVSTPNWGWAGFWTEGLIRYQKIICAWVGKRLDMVQILRRSRWHFCIELFPHTPPSGVQNKLASC